MKKVFLLYVIVPMLFTAITLAALAEGNPKPALIKTAIQKRALAECEYVGPAFETPEGADADGDSWKEAHKIGVLIHVEERETVPCYPSPGCFAGYRM